MKQPSASVRTPYELRPAVAGDEDFLAVLYASTRAEELAALPWSAAQKDSFVRQQFTLQRAHYEAHFPQAVHEIVIGDGEAVGRQWVDWRADEARLLDIALLPGWRGRGLGTSLLGDLQREVAERALVLTLSVEHNNEAAKRFYVRRGFRVVRDVGSHELLEWSPSAPA